MSQFAAYEAIIDALRAAGREVKDSGQHKATAQCPAHDDNSPSLSIGLRKDGAGAILNCHAGCDLAEVLSALKMTPRDLFDEDDFRKVYNPRADYRYPDGRVVHRKPGKAFPQSGNTKGTALFHGDRVKLAETVYIVEGEKDVLAIEAVGGVAVCSAMGAGKAHLADWSPLEGKNALIVADRDAPGRAHATAVAGLLAGVSSITKIVQSAVGKDAADHVAAGKGLDELEPCPGDPADPAADGSAEVADAAEDKPPKRSQASLLVDMAREVYELGVSDTDEPFGVHRDLPHVAMLLRGGRTGLRVGLARDYFAKHDAVASQQALADACAVLEGYASQTDPRPLQLRVAEHGGRVYVDMADAAGHVIEIGGGRWEIVDHAPTLFRRTKLTAAIPEPRGPGDLSLLWDFVLVDEQDRPLVLAWLVSALVQPEAPHPILTLLAEQGATKSSTTKKLVDLVDPSSVPLRQASRDAGAWVTAASASWVVALDNMSGTPPMWLSDSLCRAATGDGDVKRALYTDNDVTVLQMKRCVILNGIDVNIEQGDLAERVATVDLKRVLPGQRRTEADLVDAWNAARPVVFGGLLDLAAAVHHRLGAVRVAELPRMADFAKCLAAVDEVLGTAGLARYRERMKRAASDTLNDPFIASVTEHRVSVTDTPSADLLKQLTPDVAEWKRPKEWPKNARAVTGVLVRNAPALRQQGWFIDNDGGQNKSNVVLWTLTPPEMDGEQPSPPSPNSSPQVEPHKSGESDDFGSLADASPYLAASHGEEPASNAHFVDSPEIHPLSREDESASQASQDDIPSLDTVPPGGLMPHSRGQTDRVAAALAAATITVAGTDRCPQCERAKAGPSGYCDFCAARKRAIADQLATLTPNGEHA